MNWFVLAEYISGGSPSPFHFTSGDHIATTNNAITPFYFTSRKEPCFPFILITVTFQDRSLIQAIDKSLITPFLSYPQHYLSTSSRVCQYQPPLTSQYHQRHHPHGLNYFPSTKGLQNQMKSPPQLFLLTASTAHFTFEGSNSRMSLNKALVFIKSRARNARDPGADWCCCKCHCFNGSSYTCCRYCAYVRGM